MLIILDAIQNRLFVGTMSYIAEKRLFYLYDY